ncbi:MAG: hypothetical protein IKO42_05160 [Opitutales bacterium]|nr:hypothetical protein [Opitutales bacterium]
MKDEKIFLIAAIVFFLLEIAMPPIFAWLKNRIGKYALTAVLSAFFTIVYFACGVLMLLSFGGVFCDVCLVLLALLSFAALYKIFKNILRGGEDGELKTAVAQWFAMLCIAAFLIMFFGNFYK